MEDVPRFPKSTYSCFNEKARGMGGLVMVYRQQNAWSISCRVEKVRSHGVLAIQAISCEDSNALTWEKERIPRLA